ncbi:MULTISPECIES: hypothetical protein [unclassified Brachybacterium]|uniref:hypothetical protein n=1 Tax=unclassified Brachybacterium TaxID=2623841 RepID=UPI003F923E1F
MMMLLALVPFTLLTLMQLLALVALRSGLQEGVVSLAAAWPSVLAYVLAALLCCTALGLALGLGAWGNGGDHSRVLALTLGVGAGALVVLGPLLWGHAAGEFTLSHHLVRALLVAPAVVLYCWYVSAHR